MSSFNALFKDFKAQHAVSQATAAEKERERRLKEEKARTEALAREREEEKRRVLQREKDKKAKEERDRQEAALKKERQEQKEKERAAAERAEAEAAAAEKQAKGARAAGHKRPGGGGGGGARSLSKKAADPAVLGPTLSLEERRRQALRAEIAAEEAAERKSAPAFARKSSNGAVASSSRMTTTPSDRIAHLPGRRKKLASKGGGRSASIAGLDPTALVKLDKGKRDTRTIEEIEHDMRAKRLREANGGSPAPSGLAGALAKKPHRAVSGPSTSTASTSVAASGPLKRSLSGDLHETAAKKSKLSSTSPALAGSRNAAQVRAGSSKLGQQASARNGAAGKVKASLPGKRRAEPDYDDEYDSEDDDSDAYSDGRTGQGDGVKSSLKDEIWRIMGRDRNAYVGYDDDSDSDMEAGADEISREDARATRLAKEEDAREEARLAAHAEAKRKGKKGN